MYHFVRVGALGQVGRFRAVDSMAYPRRARVIVRTQRGLEIGEILASADRDVSAGGSDGDILRPMTVEDQLLEARLSDNRQEAFEACADLVRAKGLPAVLVDVENLFDGQGLFFYFLGEVTPELEACTAQLAQAYESEAQIRRFTDSLTAGCGPDCGTENAAGQGGCDSCTGCSIADACLPRA